MDNFLKLKGAGAALKAMRTESGKSQEEVANLLGWSQESLSKCENNRLDLSADDIRTFSEVLTLPLGDVVLRCFQEIRKGVGDHPNAIVVKVLLNGLGNDEGK